MRRFYRSHDRLEIYRLHDLLQTHGIVCVVRNDYLSGAAGELPPTECWPELLLIDDQDWAPARKLLEAALAPVDAAPWRCPGCGEHLDAAFGRCWRCGRDAPDDA